MTFGAAPITIPVPRGNAQRRRQDAIIDAFLVVIGIAILGGIAVGVEAVAGIVPAVAAALGAGAVAILFQRTAARLRLRSTDVLLSMMGLVMLVAIASLVVVI